MNFPEGEAPPLPIKPAILCVPAACFLPGEHRMAASDYEVFDERFRDCVNRTSHVERLWTGARWTEVPVYFPAGRYTLFSDIPNDRIMRYDKTDGSVSVYRQPSGNANGHTVHRQG